MTPTKAVKAHAYLSSQAATYRRLASEYPAMHFADKAEDYERRATELFDEVLAHRCRDCGRELSDPESIARGKGRVCAHKVSA